MPVLTEKREYRMIREMEIRSGENGEMVVEGYATTFNQPYELYREKDFVIEEQVDRNAFAETDMNDVIFQYDHEGRVFARKRNGTLEVTPDEHGLKIRANLGGTEIGRQLYEEIQGGYTDRMSFGFTVTGEEKKRTEENGVVRVLRTITRIGKLYDVSAVSLPANDATEISARGVGNGLISEVMKEIQAEADAKAERGRRIKRLKILLELEGIGAGTPDEAETGPEPDSAA